MTSPINHVAIEVKYNKFRRQKIRSYSRCRKLPTSTDDILTPSRLLFNYQKVCDVVSEQKMCDVVGDQRVCNVACLPECRCSKRQIRLLQLCSIYRGCSWCSLWYSRWNVSWCWRRYWHDQWSWSRCRYWHDHWSWCRYWHDHWSWCRYWYLHWSWCRYWHDHWSWCHYWHLHWNWCHYWHNHWNWCRYWHDHWSWCHKRFTTPSVVSFLTLASWTRHTSASRMIFIDCACAACHHISSRIQHLVGSWTTMNHCKK
jgi:hypothetical protein